MKKLTHSLLAKVIAVFLVTIVFFATAVCAVSVGVFASYGGYFQSYDSLREKVVEDYLWNYPYRIASDYSNGYAFDENGYDYDFYYTIYSEKGEVLETNYNGEEYIGSIRVNFVPSSYYYRYGIIEDETEDFASSISNDYYTVELRAKSESQQSGLLLFLFSVLNVLYTLRFWLIAFILVGVILFFALATFLFCSAGHVAGKEEITCNYVDKIPFDFFTAFYIVIAMFEYALMSGIDGSIPLFVVLCIFLFVDFLLGMLYCLSIATRIKTGTLFSNTFSAVVLRALAKTLKKFYRSTAYLFKNLSLVWKLALGLGGIMFLDIILAGMWGIEDVLILLPFEAIIASVILLYAAISFEKLKTASKRIAEGEINTSVDTEHMRFDFKEMGENLNHITEGLGKAVDERMKSERFKTELITNVSHDIKTPLTSIINYVDLIKKEKIENDTVSEYVEVLDRQSVKLKKLIEDLIEASKASTGNLSVNLSYCEIGVLLEQTAAEYQEKLEKANLDLVISQPEQAIGIEADGRHLWRIFDNLLNNIVKYALPGTRVYLTLERVDRKARITFRNISREKLEISGNDLTERFVRGDSSRNTEGSGLGLSIAKSLTELQKGSLQITVDGDLFKVVLEFNAQD